MAAAPDSWALVLVGVATLLALLAKYGLGRKWALKLPPGPRNWPLIGAFADLKPPRHKAFERLAEKYGPIVYLRLGVQTMVVVSSAELAEEVVKQKDLEFADRATAMNRSAGRFIGFKSTALPWANYDAQTKLVRKIVATEFFTTGKLRSHEQIRTHEIGVMVEKISARLQQTTSDDAQTAALVAIKGASRDVVQNVMFQLDFGRRFDDLEPSSDLRKVPVLLKDRLKIFMKFNMVDYFPSRILEWLDPQGMLTTLRRMEKLQDDLYSGIVEDQRRLRQSIKLSEDKGRARNLVDVLLQVQEEGGKISDDAIMAAFSSMLSAGIDTTAGQVEWTLLELARHPAMMQRLQAEIDGVVGKERPVVESDLPALPFLNAVVVESLRLRPVGGFTFPHVNRKPATIGGYDIPANTAVLLNIFSISRDPKWWKDPLEFYPDRFLVDGRLADQASWNSFNLIPFGGGRRGCPGWSLAKLLVLRTVATLVHAFDWSPPPGLSADDISPAETGHFSLYPVTPLVLTPRSRLSPGVY